MTRFRTWTYDHDSVPTEFLISKPTLRLMFVLAGMLFKDSDDKRLKKLEMTERLRSACSVILECRVQHISKLAQVDASIVLGKLEQYAKTTDEWKPRVAPEPQDTRETHEANWQPEPNTCL